MNEINTQQMLTDESNKVIHRLDEIKQDLDKQLESKAGAISAESKASFIKATEELTGLKKKIDNLDKAVKQNAVSKSLSNEDPEQRSKLGSFLRKSMGGSMDQAGAEIQIKAHRTDSNPDGGYLVLPEYDAAIGKIIFETSPISRLATRRTVAGNEYKKIIRDNVGGSSKYKQELEDVNDSDTATYKEVSIGLHTLYASYPVSSEMLEDAAYNVESELQEAIREDFGLDVERDMIAGNGVKTARGITTYADAGYTAGQRTYEFGKIERVPSGGASAIGSVENILNLYMALKPQYQGNATWIMKSHTFLDILKLKSTSNYHFLGFQPSKEQTGAPVLSIMGRPVEFAEDMDSNGTGGNVIVGFGDIARAYTMIEKPGMSILRDPYSKHGRVLYKVAKRIGGGIVNFDALKLMDVAAS